MYATSGEGISGIFVMVQQHPQEGKVKKKKKTGDGGCLSALIESSAD